jgi:hypothetical protein
MKLELSTGDIPPVLSINSGKNKGTYAVKEIVYGYAMWMSAKFAVHVIQTFDRVTIAEHQQLENAQKTIEAQAEKLSHASYLHPESVSAVTGTRNTKAVKEVYDELINAGYVIDEPENIVKSNYRVTHAGLEAGFYNCEKSIVRVSQQARELLLKMLLDKDAQQTRWND